MIKFRLFISRKKTAAVMMHSPQCIMLRGRGCPWVLLMVIFLLSLGGSGICHFLHYKVTFFSFKLISMLYGILFLQIGCILIMFSNLLTLLSVFLLSLSSGFSVSSINIFSSKISNFQYLQRYLMFSFIASVIFFMSLSIIITASLKNLS